MTKRVDLHITAIELLGKDTGGEIQLKPRLEQLETITILEWVEAIAENLKYG